MKVRLRDRIFRVTTVGRKEDRTVYVSAYDSLAVRMLLEGFGVATRNIRVALAPGNSRQAVSVRSAGRILATRGDWHKLYQELLPDDIKSRVWLNNLKRNRYKQHA